MDIQKLLTMMEQNARMTCAQMAVMLGCTEQEVAETVGRLEQDKTIIGYTALVDWEKTQRESVTALIEVKVVPQRGDGFDRVASRIYQYNEVDSVYLMSGGFDLMVMITGKTLKEVALFVAQKLSVMDSVSATATHFVLKRYKDKGIIFASEPGEDKRMMYV